MRLHSLILLAGLSLLSSPLMAQPEKPVATPKVEPAAKIEALPEPVITLLDAGAKEGRRELRFKLIEGATHTMVMSMKNRQRPLNGRAASSSNWPAMVFTAAMKVEKVEKSGDAHCVAEFIDVTVADEAGVQPAVRDGTQKTAEMIKGTIADIIMSDRGFYRSSKMRDVNDVRLMRVMDSMNQGMQQAFPLLPQEPVGVGAKWQVVTTPNLGGIIQTITTTHTLTSLTADGATFDLVIARTAKEQDVESPAGPPGMSVKVKSLSGAGNGSTEVLFTRPTPIASTTTSKGTVDMTIKLGDDSSVHQLEMTFDVKIEGKPTAATK